MAGSWRLTDERGGQVVAHLQIAHRFWQRLAGWQFRSRRGDGHGLLLVPCASVHTFWMRFSIDVIGLAAGGEVSGVIRDLRPWRLASLPRGTLAVLEVPAGNAAKLELRQRLRLDASSGPAVPAKVAGLFSATLEDL